MITRKTAIKLLTVLAAAISGTRKVESQTAPTGSTASGDISVGGGKWVTAALKPYPVSFSLTIDPESTFTVTKGSEKVVITSDELWQALKS